MPDDGISPDAIAEMIDVSRREVDRVLRKAVVVRS